MIPTLQWCKPQKFSSNLLTDGVNWITRLPNLKLHSLTVFNIRKTLPHGIDEFQTSINPVFQPFCEEDDNYDGSDYSPPSPRDLHFSQSESESSNTVVMPVVVIEAVNLKEQLPDMKAKLDQLLWEKRKKGGAN